MWLLEIFGFLTKWTCKKLLYTALAFDQMILFWTHNTARDWIWDVEWNLRSNWFTLWSAPIWRNQFASQRRLKRNLRKFQLHYSVQVIKISFHIDTEEPIKIQEENLNFQGKGHLIVNQPRDIINQNWNDSWSIGGPDASRPSGGIRKGSTNFRSLRVIFTWLIHSGHVYSSYFLRNYPLHNILGIFFVLMLGVKTPTPESERESPWLGFRTIIRLQP